MSRNINYIKLINSRRWVKLRFEKLRSNPLCERCLSDDLTTPATTVHHKIPVETGVTFTEMERLAFDFNNLKSVCAPCHVLEHIDLQSKSKDSIKANNARKKALFVEKYL